MTNLTKKEIQQRVLQNGKPLDLDKFEWDKETRTFSTNQHNLVLDFSNLDCITFKTGDYCTFTTSYNCIFTTGRSCVFTTAWDCVFTTGRSCVFNTGWDCVFKTGDDCVIVNRNVYEVIIGNKDDIIQIPRFGIKGHIKNSIYSETGKKSIIADEILSEIISKKGNVYKVINHGKSEPSYLIQIEKNNKKIYSHGKTLKEAKKSLIYKLADRDTSKYKNLELDSILSKDEAIQCYMTITGACSAGTKYFIDNLDEVKKEYSIKEIIDITQSQFGNNLFKEFFKK